MNFRQLETFVCVAENRSFVKAARNLYISQPAISQQIQKIEEELGVPLLIRDHHNVTLTEAGEIFYKNAGQILQIYEQTAIKCLRTVSVQTELLIGYVGQTHYHVLPALISAFHRIKPECTIRTQRLKPIQILSSLTVGKFSMVLTPYDLIEAAPGIFFRHLYNDQHYCVMQASHPLAGHTSIMLKDLEGQTILIPDRDFCPSHMQKLLHTIKTELSDVTFQNGGNIDNAAAHLLSTNAVALMPGYARPPHPALIAVPLADPVPIPFVAAYCKKLTATEEAFLKTSILQLKMHPLL